MTERILFVCVGNIHRSVTAEELYRDDSRYEVRSAGVHPRARRRLTEGDLSWAHRVFAMGSDVFERMQQHDVNLMYTGLDTSSFINLGIPDRFDTSYPDEKRRLLELVKQKLDPYLGEPQTGQKQM